MLDEGELKSGLKFIVGTWRPDYIVSAFSNDLEHIPVSEFKGDDGRDFSALTFEFFEDHKVTLTDAGSGREENGVWEQTDRYKYHYTFDAFFDIPDGDFKEKAEKLEVVDGKLVFTIGFLAVALAKTADGKVTEEPDIGDIPMSEADMLADAIVGRYSVAEMMTAVGDGFGLYSREAVEKDLKARNASDEEAAEALSGFDSVFEFTPDHTVVTWMKIPAGVSQEEIDEAVRSGEIGEIRDGYFAAGKMEWKSLNGKYYVNTGEESELFDENGLLPFCSGLYKLRRIG